MGLLLDGALEAANSVVNMGSENINHHNVHRLETDPIQAAFLARKKATQKYDLCIVGYSTIEDWVYMQLKHWADLTECFVVPSYNHLPVKNGVRRFLAETDWFEVRAHDGECLLQNAGL